jgi:predicted lipoprotein with Yx(FWY)xxD motif
MKNQITFFLVMLFVLGCSSSSDNEGMNDDGPVGGDPTDDYSPPDDDMPPMDDPDSVRLVSNGTFGSILTDTDGRTLYFFSLDSKGESNCIDGCLSVWPVFHASDLTLDEGLDSSDFGTITRTDGAMQTTYKGWPLYYYADDSVEGDVNGDGFNDVWYVAKPDYSVMKVRAQLVGRDSGGVETNLTSNYEPGDEQTFYMTDAYGNTLYLFSNDENGVNNFTADDFSNNGVWPIFEETLMEVPSTFSSGDFGSIDVFGRQQLTYKGWPLYYFGQDEERGDNYGVGFPSAGIWPIANSDTETAPEPPSTTISYDVANQEASAYVLDGDGLSGAVNPDLTLKRGNTYEFNVSAPGHPFWIKTVQSIGTGDTYNDGVTNNGTASGTVTFTVPNDAPDTLFYVCEFHIPMTGTLNIVD